MIPSPWDDGKPRFKDEVGTYRDEQRTKRREWKQAEDAVMAKAKRRDGNRCRWPHCTNSHLVVDAAHLEHRKMGGDRTLEKTQRHLLIALCRRHHKQMDHGPLSVRPLTERGTDGPCEYYDGDRLVGRERTTQISEERGQ